MFLTGDSLFFIIVVIVPGAIGMRLARRWARHHPYVSDTHKVATVAALTPLAFFTLFLTFYFLVLFLWYVF